MIDFDEIGVLANQYDHWVRTGLGAAGTLAVLGLRRVVAGVWAWLTKPAPVSGVVQKLIEKMKTEDGWKPSIQVRTNGSEYEYRMRNFDRDIRVSVERQSGIFFDYFVTTVNGVMMSGRDASALSRYVVAEVRRRDVEDERAKKAEASLVLAAKLK